ncbi:MAG: helix-turn-helix transcriptional regulator [Chamaesiphon sp.]|nr:helix-turn-helix transcriptional regulator [Chamaesiphon sp.]
MQQLNQGIQQLYTIHNLDTFGLDTLKIIDRLVPADLPSFQSTHVPTRQLSGVALYPSPEFFTPELTAVVQQHYRQHPIVEHLEQTFHGAYKISDFVSQQAFHRLEGLYQQYLRPFGIEDQMTLFLPPDRSISSAHLAPKDETLVGFALNRAERSFSERDRLILNLLRPHLFQAYTNAQKFRQLEQNACQLQELLDDLGTIVLNTEGRIISIAPQAIIWLETYFIKSSYCTQIPDHLWSWVKHQVDYLAHKPCLDKVCRLLRVQKNGRELTVRLILESDLRYLLLLEEQTLSSFDFLKFLGLSQRETEVLQWLMQGKDNKYIAVQLTIKVSTVRKHLENIYLKLGVRSRAEAISYALDKLGLLQSRSLIK